MAQICLGFKGRMGRELVLLLPAMVVVLLLLLLKPGHCADFHSDELEEEEWGIVGNVVPVRASVESAPSDSSKVQFPLEHSLGSSKFSPAGTFTARLRPSLRGGQTLVKLRLSRNPFSEDEKKAFKELLEKDGLYSIRVPATPLNPGKAFVISSAKARCLAAADFKERFDIYMEQGHIISIGYNAAEECTYPRMLKYPTNWAFDTHIVSKSGEQASRVAFVSELDAAVEQKQLGDENLQLEKPVEKSFWAKYWIYIVPLGLIVMNAITQIANLQDEPAGTPGQQAAVAAAGATAGRGGATARRR